MAVKILEWRKILLMRQADQMNDEVNIARVLFGSHFITQMYSTVSWRGYLGCVLEYVNGGELFYWLRKFTRFSLYATMFYASEILCGLKYIHSKKILYRDLKPENILITADGHVKITDFGFSVRMVDKAYLVSGTPEYMAPEKLLNEDDGIESDYWALGVIMYEMLFGDPPFYSQDTNMIYKKILEEDVLFPVGVDDYVGDVIYRLLDKNRTTRLGHKGIEEIMGHPFFQHVNWPDVIEGRMMPPFLPRMMKVDERDLFVEESEGEDSFIEAYQINNK